MKRACETRDQLEFAERNNLNHEQRGDWRTDKTQQ